MQSRMLRSMGYAHGRHRRQRRGGAGAAGRATGWRSTSILCDLNMPGVDGIEFLHGLLASPFRGSVILLSGEGVRIMHTVQKLLAGTRAGDPGRAREAGQPRGAARFCSIAGSRSIDARSASDLHWPSPKPSCIRPAGIDQWVLHYQPKVDLRSGALVGTEALVRWNHPVHGLLYPDSFIGVAEDCGAIDAMTDWVLTESIRQLAPLAPASLRLQMASTCRWRTCAHPTSRREWAQLVRNSCVSPQDLTLEMTESRLMALGPAPLETPGAAADAALRPVDRRLRHRPLVARAAARRAVHRAEDRSRLRPRRSPQPDHPADPRRQHRHRQAAGLADSWPKASRQPTTGNCCARSAATSPRATSSAGRCLPRPSRNGWRTGRHGFRRCCVRMS